MASQHRGVALRQLETVFRAGAIGSLPDGVLLERFLSGGGDADSSAAFTMLVERHGPMVLGVCGDVLRNDHDAEDAAQATFLILAKKGGSIRRVDSLASWLFGVALRVAAKSKAQATGLRAIERRVGQMKARSERTSRESLVAELHEELGRLPERYRAPIVLCHLEGLSNEQVAGQLGLPVRTVQRRLARGRERLRARLAGRDPDRAFVSIGLGIAMHTTPGLWFDSTVRAASSLCAGRAIASAASPAVAILTKAVLASARIEQFKFVVACVAAALLLAAAGATSVIGAWRPDLGIAAGGDSSNGAEDPVGVGARLWIRGIVVDTAGEPVGGARVTSRVGRQPRVVTAKPDGTFAIWSDQTPARFASLLATADGGARQGVFRFYDRLGVRQELRTLARIVLKRAHSITVSVVDSRGVAVEGARVVPLDLASAVDVGVTDARGVVTVRAPADAIMDWILAYKPGVGLDYFENDPFMPLGWSALPDRVELRLNGARTVRVKVVDSGNHPVPEVDVLSPGIHKAGKLSAVNVWGSPARVRTDAGGIATFDWLPAEIQARTTFMVDAPGYSALHWPILDPAAPVAELTVHLLRATRLSGKITRPDGSPAAGIPVFAECLVFTSPPSAGQALTAADGSYAMDLPPDRPYTVYVAHDGLVARSRNNVELLEGKPATEVDLRLKKGAIIRGRVTFGEPPQPAGGAFVSIISEDPDAQPSGGKTLRNERPPTVETDQDGRYVFLVEPGKYSLRGPFARGARAIPEMLYAGAGQEFERSFRLDKPPEKKGMLRGVVRSGERDGPAIARAIVVVAPVDTESQAWEAFAGGDGRFELPRPSGRFAVYARNSAGNLAGYTTLGADQNAEVTIVARPAAIARGRLVDRAGVPWSYARVVLAVLPAVSAGDDFEFTAQWVMSDSQGRFTVAGLPPGTRCEVYAVDPNHGGGVARRKRVDVVDTKAIDLGDMITHPR